MKLLLTSAGIKNASIHNTLVGMLGKPIAECSALCIPTALYAYPGGDHTIFVCGNDAAAKSRVAEWLRACGFVVDGVTG